MMSGEVLAAVANSEMGSAPALAAGEAYMTCTLLPDVTCLHHLEPGVHNSLVGGKCLLKACICDNQYFSHYKHVVRVRYACMYQLSSQCRSMGALQCKVLWGLITSRHQALGIVTSRHQALGLGFVKVFLGVTNNPCIVRSTLACGLKLLCELCHGLAHGGGEHCAGHVSICLARDAGAVVLNMIQSVQRCITITPRLALEPHWPPVDTGFL